MDDAPPWIDGEPPRPRPRRGLLLAAATLPWLVLGVVVFGPSAAREELRDTATAVTVPGEEAPGPAGTLERPGDDRDPSLDRDPDGAASGHAGHASSDPAPDLGGVPGAPLPDDAPTARTTEVTDGDVAAVATATVRAWLSEDGSPALRVDGVTPISGHYLEHATARRIEVVGPDHAVVTVAVLLLDRDGDRWAGLRSTDVLVPVTITATDAHPAGAPWWGPRDVSLAPRPLTTVVEDDPALAAELARVLGDAGYRDVEVRQVAGADDGVLEVDLRATGPHGIELDGPLWVVRTSTGLHVLGAGPPPRPS